MTTNEQSKTPLTDKEAFNQRCCGDEYQIYLDCCADGDYVSADFARTLELQLQAVTRQRDVAVEELKNAPHAEVGCCAPDWRKEMQDEMCSCWKRDALARIEAAKEGK